MPGLSKDERAAQAKVVHDKVNERLAANASLNTEERKADAKDIADLIFDAIDKGYATRLVSGNGMGVQTPSTNEMTAVLAGIIVRVVTKTKNGADVGHNFAQALLNGVLSTELLGAFLPKVVEDDAETDVTEAIYLFVTERPLTWRQVNKLIEKLGQEGEKLPYQRASNFFQLESLLRQAKTNAGALANNPEATVDFSIAQYIGMAYRTSTAGRGKLHRAGQGGAPLFNFVLKVLRDEMGDAGNLEMDHLLFLSNQEVLAIDAEAAAALGGASVARDILVDICEIASMLLASSSYYKLGTNVSDGGKFGGFPYLYAWTDLMNHVAELKTRDEHKTKSEAKLVEEVKSLPPSGILRPSLALLYDADDPDYNSIGNIMRMIHARAGAYKEAHFIAWKDYMDGAVEFGRILKLHNLG
jgi:hypothetical protein